MGRKVHPTGFRVGIIRDWQAKWYAGKNYVQLLQEDLKLRQAISSKYTGAGISLVEIDRQGDRIMVNIHTSRPGVVIGRGGQRVDEMRKYLESHIGNRVQLNIQEIRQPELDAYLVADAVAEQIGRRVAYRRAMKQAISRTIEAGAKGIRICCSGRLAGAEIARREVLHQGQVPLHKLRADIDYGFTEARTTLGRIGVKVWIYKGDILPEAVVEEAEEALGIPMSQEPAGVLEPGEKLVGPVSGAESEVAPAVGERPSEVRAEEAEAAAPVEVPPAEEVEARETGVEVAPPVEAAPSVKAKEKVKKPAGKKVEEAEAAAPAEAPEAETGKEIKRPTKRRKKAEVEATASTESVPGTQVEGAAEKPKRARRKKTEAGEAVDKRLEGQDATTEAS